MSTEQWSVPQKCMACSAELTSPVVCAGCHTLYPVPQSADHFSVLGLPRTYDLDLDALEDRFLELSRHTHPDFFSGASAGDQQLATRVSAELNEAIKVLRHPVLRAGYLLEICGGASAASDRTVPSEVLGETMMLREEIEDAQNDNDADALNALRARVDERCNAWLEKIQTLARKLPDASKEEQAALRHAINAIKYYDNMRELLSAA